jgi:L-alanine-DL-glutamate epimerase-like enolase superfamily enzyme
VRNIGRPGVAAMAISAVDIALWDLKAPNLHARVAVAVPNLRHVEYFHDHQRIERMLFDGALDPAGGVMTPDLGRPELGMRLREADADPYRRG